MRIDHGVRWVADPLKSVEFYERVLGVAGVRVEEFKAGKVLFPSVRLADDALIDFMATSRAMVLNAIPGAAGSAGNKVNHVCLALTKDEFDAVRARVETAVPMKDSFGAQGAAPEACYFADPDGNIIEIRYYA